MSAGAAPITVSHPPSDPERFGRWVAGYQACARHSFAYVSARESVQGSGQLDWSVEVAFHNADLLDTWLDSPERQAVLRDGDRYRLDRATRALPAHRLIAAALIILCRSATDHGSASWWSRYPNTRGVGRSKLPTNPPAATKIWPVTSRAKSLAR
jgi:hypothetical protein